MKRIVFAFTLTLVSLSLTVCCKTEKTKREEIPAFLGIQYGLSREKVERVLRERFGEVNNNEDSYLFVEKPIIGGVEFDCAYFFFTEDRKHGLVFDGGRAVKEVTLEEKARIDSIQRELIIKLKKRYGRRDVIVTSKKNGDKRVDFLHIGKKKNGYGTLLIYYDMPVEEGHCALILDYDKKLQTREADL